MPRTWDIEFMSHGEYVCPYVYSENGWYFVSSTQSKLFHIFPYTLYLVRMNSTILVNVQHTFHFDLDLIGYQGGTFCVRLSLNRFTNVYKLYANQLHIHYRC